MAKEILSKNGDYLNRVWIVRDAYGGPLWGVYTQEYLAHEAVTTVWKTLENASDNGVEIVEIWPNRHI